MSFIRNHLKQLFNALICLCILFGAMNIVFGFFVIYGYFSVQGQLSTTSQYLNQSLQASQSLIRDTSALTNNATSEISIVDKNLTGTLTSIKDNLTVIGNSFNQEAGYFGNLTMPGLQKAQAQQIASGFMSISAQLNYTRTRTIPQLLKTINSSGSSIDKPLTSINQSTAALSLSVVTLLGSSAAELSSTEQAISILMLVFAVYLMIQGAVFILFGVLLIYV
jgi:predicted PurR-regulated permease PerM